MSNTTFIMLIMLYGLIYLYFCASILWNLMFANWPRMRSSMGKLILMSFAPLIIWVIV